MHVSLRTCVVAVTTLFAVLPGRQIAGQVADDTLRRVVTLPAIVVTATKFPVAAVTGATTVLLGDALRAEGITSVVDALRRVPGLAVVATGSPGARTSVYTRGGENGYTRVLVDGVAVNDPGGEFDYAYLTLDDVDRIEIVRGPSSVLYGTDAVTGVIQVFTRRGSGPLRVIGGGRGGTHDTRTLSANVSGSTPSTRFSFGGARHATSGIHQFNSDYDRTSVTGSVEVRPDASTDARLHIRYADYVVHIPTDGSGAVVDHNAFQFGQRLTMGAEIGRAVTPRLELRLLLGAHTTDGGFDNAPDGPADTLGFFASSGLNHVVRRNVEFRTNFRITPTVVLTAGSAFEHQRERSFNESQSEFGPSNGSFAVSRRTSAGYAQLLGVRGELTWNAGVRLDDNDAFGTFLTWRGGLAYRIANGTRVRAVVGTAFREPTFFQNFAEGFVVGNPDLRPEQSRSWEVGVEQDVAHDRIALRATWFDQRFTDLIEYSFATAEPGDPNYVNVAGAAARGAEFELDARVMRTLVASVSHTWVDSRITASGIDQSGTGFFVPGSRLLRRPAHTTNAGVSWTVDQGTTVSAQAMRFGAREDLDYNAGARTALPAYTTLDLAGSFTVRRPLDTRPGVAVNVRLANALDEQYTAVLGFRAPGRSVAVGVRVY